MFNLQHNTDSLGAPQSLSIFNRFQGRYYFEQMHQIKPKLKEGTKIDKAKIFVCTLYVCVTIRSSGCPIMWFRIAENGSVNGDAVSPR